ncbi:helix-turn-helix domain-containing protein [Streptomyces sp. NPDC088745]|uniref:helix-turn-helix domain-containing protein n=1 Tax=Streptomyces sp. NPDC088745 TaxID=3365884 RepID=UPI00382058CA
MHKEEGTVHSGDRGSKAFGALLRFLREKAGLSQDALAARIGFSKSQVAMVERGERRPRGRFVLRSDNALGAQGALRHVADAEFGDAVVDEPPLNDLDLEEYLAEERNAASIRSYQNVVIPGLLQTEAYARAVHQSLSYPTLDDEEVEEQVAFRMDRKALFHRKPAPDLSFVLEESTLTRPLGSTSTLKAALQHLIELGELRHVRVQVMPHNVQFHPGLMGCITLLETRDHRHAAYVEGQRANRYLNAPLDVGNLNGIYGVLQSQALTQQDSAKLIAKVAQEL